jgi:lysophospholipase L1-like esterase
MTTSSFNLCSAMALAAAAFAAHGQDFLTVPAVYTHSPGVFEGMFERARCGTVRAILFGDSQETCPGGAGALYIPRLQYEFWSRYGNAPETPLAPMYASYGTPPVAADWLLRVANPPGGVQPSRLVPEFLPPGFTACATTTIDGSNVGGQWYPQAVLVQHDGIDLPAATLLAGVERYFDAGRGVYIDVVAATNASSGEVRVQVLTAPSRTPNFAALPYADVQTSMGLESPVAGIRSVRLGPFPAPGPGYVQVSVSGTDPGKFTDIVGVRVVSAASPRGWGMTSFSQGGYGAHHLTALHGQCGPVLAAVAPDVCFLAYGANDAGNWVSPQGYRAALAADIAFIRSHTRGDLPVIVLGDPYRSDLADGRQANHDLYPRAAMELAEADPLVCAVNSRRLTHEAGWTPGALVYLSDNVHYSALGAHVKARVEAEALFDAFLWTPPCRVSIREVPCDSRTVCERHAGLPVPTEDGLRAPCDLDFNLDGNTDQDDLALFVALLAGGPNPNGIDPDLNGDGNADQDDLAWLVSALAGGGC